MSNNKALIMQTRNHLLQCTKKILISLIEASSSMQDIILVKDEAQSKFSKF